MILEHLHFCLANHACVSHLLRGKPHISECYYRNCLIGTHMYIQYRNNQFFLPFSVNCSQVAIFKVMPALCPQGQGEGERRGGRGAQPNVDRPGKGEGESHEFPNLCIHPLWMIPYIYILLCA